MAETYTVTRRQIPWHPYAPDRPLPLGRHVNHDSRSLAYPWQRRSGAPLVTILHSRRVPIFDQGSLGSCTGNGEEGCLGTDPLFTELPKGTVLSEAGAVKIYSAAEKIDGGAGYPPEDEGSSGLSAAKAAKAMGLISGFVHCLSLADVLSALQTYPVSIGINWYSSFDEPPASGLLTISPGADVRGGHEPMLRGVDVAAQTVFGDNSWGESWGVKGSFTMGWTTLDRLLHEQGDGTVSLPLTAPAPTPVPVPTPAPVPVPPGDDEDEWLIGQLEMWAAERHVGANERAARAYESWKAAKGL